MKTREDNDMTDRTNVVHAENEIEPPWLIESSVVYDENKIGQWHDQLYRCNTYKKWN